uniref:Uncharacterized protein n=1 Tax=Plectus sambesii TaxID=2011161 RepID=A0A914UUG9_9BILA
MNNPLASECSQQLLPVSDRMHSDQEGEQASVGDRNRPLRLSPNTVFRMETLRKASSLDTGLVLQVPEITTENEGYGEAETSLLTAGFNMNSSTMTGGVDRKYAQHQPLSRQISPSLSCLPYPTPVDVHLGVDHGDFPPFHSWVAHIYFTLLVTSSNVRC